MVLCRGLQWHKADYAAVCHRLPRVWSIPPIDNTQTTMHAHAHVHTQVNAHCRAHVDTYVHTYGYTHIYMCTYGYTLYLYSHF